MLYQINTPDFKEEVLTPAFHTKLVPHTNIISADEIKRHLSLKLESATVVLENSQRA